MKANKIKKVITMMLIGGSGLFIGSSLFVGATGATVGADGTYIESCCDDDKKMMVYLSSELNSDMNMVEVSSCEFFKTMIVAPSVYAESSINMTISNVGENFKYSGATEGVIDISSISIDGVDGISYVQNSSISVALTYDRMSDLEDRITIYHNLNKAGELIVNRETGLLYVNSNSGREYFGHDTHCLPYNQDNILTGFGVEKVVEDASIGFDEVSMAMKYLSNINDN